MNVRALTALVAAAALGTGLVAQGWHEGLGRVIATGCFVLLLRLGLEAAVLLLKRLPRAVCTALFVATLLITLRAGYFLVRFHGTTWGLYVGAGLFGVMALWRSRFRLPRLTARTSVLVASFCGLGLVVQGSTFPPRELLPTVRRWRHEPRTRTPLGVVAHVALLGGLGLLGAGGLYSVFPLGTRLPAPSWDSGSDETDPATEPSSS